MMRRINQCGIHRELNKCHRLIGLSAYTDDIGGYCEHNNRSISQFDITDRMLTYNNFKLDIAADTTLYDYGNIQIGKSPRR